LSGSRTGGNCIKLISYIDKGVWLRFIFLAISLFLRFIFLLRSLRVDARFCQYVDFIASKKLMNDELEGI
jgi:hypothetical protein